MILWRVLTVFFGLLITAPVVILNANGYNIAFWIDQDAIETTQTGTAVSVPDPIVPPRDRPQVQAMFATDHLTNARYIEVTEIITQADLLTPGEATPDDTLVPLYTAARAPARLIRYCDDVIATIGTACDVINTTTRENQNGKLELTGQLAFIPAYVMGDPYSMADGALVQASIDLPHNASLLPANEPATRIDAMNRAVALCSMLRETFGNCVVSQISFAVQELWITDLEALPAGTNPQRLSVRAHFTVFADQTKLDSAGLQQQLENLTNPA